MSTDHRSAPPAASTVWRHSRVVAERRHLPGVRAQLPGLRRRRRSATSAASAPGSPTCAASASTGSGSTRSTPLPSTTTATTSPTTWPSTRVRRPGRVRPAGARRPPARPQGHHRRRAQPLLDRAPVVHRRPGCRSGQRRTPPLPLRRRHAASTASCRRTTGARSSADPRGAGSASPTARRGSGTCTPSPPSRPTSTGATRTSPEHFEQVLRFWFDRGVDGLRIDVAHGLHKREGLPDHPFAIDDELTGDPVNPHAWNQPEVHDVWRSWRAIAEEYTDADRSRAGAGRRGRRARRRPSSPPTSARTSCTRASSSSSCAPPGTQRRCSRVDRSRPRAPWPPSAPRSRGC